jgi:anti-sigma regulatory factor (Ser/Thr protein kinase)
MTDTFHYATAHELVAVRRFVRARAQALGLEPTRIDSLVLAVSELASNTLRHTAGGGRIRIWVDDRHVVCEVTDEGHHQPFGRPMPPPDAVSGRGLAIVERICDEVSTSTGPAGTWIRLRFRR